MCAVTSIEMTILTPESLLNSCRKLFRDPHSLTSRLVDMEPLSSVEAQGLAPFLLLETEYKQTVDKDVNHCYEALHGWLSAFYFFSAVSDQVSQVAKDLASQEALLRRLGGQTDEPKRRGSALGHGWPCSPDSHKSQGERSMPDRNAVPPKAITHNRVVRDTRGRESVAPGVATKVKTMAGATRSPPLQQSSSNKSLGSVFGNTGISRRRSGSPSNWAGAANRAGGLASGVTRTQSDKALSQVLRTRKKEACVSSSVQSPQRTSGRAVTNSIGTAGGCASPNGTRAPASRLGRQPAGMLPTVPERYSSVPSMPETLLESIHRRSSAPLLKESDIPNLA